MTKLPLTFWCQINKSNKKMKSAALWNVRLSSEKHVFDKKAAFFSFKSGLFHNLTSKWTVYGADFARFWATNDIIEAHGLMEKKVCYVVTTFTSYFVRYIIEAHWVTDKKVCYVVTTSSSDFVRHMTPTWSLFRTPYGVRTSSIKITYNNAMLH